MDVDTRLLRYAIRRKYSATAFEAMIMPICKAVGERAPIRSAWQSSQPRWSEADRSR